MQRGTQVCTVLVASVLLMALLNGCPGGDGDRSRFAGTWRGTTSQGQNVSFVITNDNMFTQVRAEARITGDACTAADLVLFPQEFTREPIVGDRFSFVLGTVVPAIAIFPPPVAITQVVMTGMFTDESTASGELRFTANLAPSPCAGTATVTFQARKQ